MRRCEQCGQRNPGVNHKDGTHCTIKAAMRWAGLRYIRFDPSNVLHWTAVTAFVREGKPS